MPEGDTIRRTAQALHAALAGRALGGFASMLPAVEAAAARLRLVGREIEAVEARGKHLLVRFTGGVVLHTHLGMHGSWHVRRTGGPRAAGRGARARLETAEAVALCFGAPVVELLAPADLAAHPALARLGPDLLGGAFDAAAARARLRQLAGEPIGVALLDQTALSGIGNVYKSEVLFLRGVDPRRRVADLDDAALDALVAEAGRLLERNLGPGMRRTTPALTRERLWVYGRAGRPCQRCGAPVERIVQGGPSTDRLPRLTWFCPACQR
jgi:endonuclease-8